MDSPLNNAEVFPQLMALRQRAQERRRATLLAWTNSPGFIADRLADLIAPLPPVSVDSHNDAYRELEAVVGSNMKLLLGEFAAVVIRLADQGVPENEQREENTPLRP